MGSTDDTDWEEYFEDYVREHQDMPFTQVLELIVKKLHISLEEIVSDRDGGSIIDHIWNPDDTDMTATELIDFVAKARRVSVTDLLLDPNGKEVLNDFYKDRIPFGTSTPSPLSNPSTTSSKPQTERLLSGTDGPTSTGLSPSAQSAADTISQPSKHRPRSKAQSRTKADRVAAFVEVPLLIAGTMAEKPWRKLSDGINAIVRQVAGRLGQAKFRQDLFENYGCRCLITGCTVPHVVEAAHIKPYKSKGDFTVDNGLPLRSDLHMLFDQNLLAFHPDILRVELHPKLKETEYKSLADQFLKVDDARIKPSLEALQERYDAFLGAQQIVDYSYADLEE